MGDPTWAVFTKPWATLSAEELGPLVARLGFDGAEVPVREGAHLTPEEAERRLPRFVQTLGDAGVATIAVAADPSERVLAACAAAGVPTVRVMAPVRNRAYRESVAQVRADLETALPLCQQYGIRVGVQPHHGQFVTTVLGVLDLLDGLPEATAGVVWDAAHDALAGEDPVTTLTLSWARLMIVNLKNARYERVLGAGGEHRWAKVFGSARDGLANWTQILRHLHDQEWQGPICLTGQYTEARDDSELAARLVAADLAYAKELWTSFSPESQASD